MPAFRVHLDTGEAITVAAPAPKHAGDQAKRLRPGATVTKIKIDRAVDVPKRGQRRLNREDLTCIL